MKKKKSAFETWFIAQHGKRPIQHGSDKRFEDMVEQGEAAMRHLQATYRYDARMQSALYAWNIKDSQK